MLLPAPYSVLAKGGAALLLIGGLWAANQYLVVSPAVNAETARWQQRWDKRDKADAAAALAQEKINREKEQALQAAADAEQQKADAARADADRRIAASRAVSQQLQNGVEQALQQLGSYTTASAGRPTTTSAGLLLTELYRSIDERAGDLAAEADRRREAGLTCQRLYDNARQEKAR